MPVKKVEISERESIQEFPENRSDRFSRRLVLSLKVNSICCFFWVFRGEGGQDRIPTLLLSPKAAQLVANLLVEHNTRKLQGLVQNVYDILLVLLVEEYFSRSTIHDQAFFFFVFLKKIPSHSPCQFAEGPPARRQDPKSTLVALTAAPLILPFFQVQDKTSRDSLSFSQLARCVASWSRGGIFRRRPPAARSVKHPAGGACSTKTGRRAGRCKSLEVEQEQRELRLEPYPSRSDALESSRRRRGALNPKKLVGKPLSLRARNKRALTRWRRPRSRD